AMLDGDHASRRKVLAVPGAVDLVDDGRVEITAPQEVRVQRVHHAILDRGGGRKQRLPQPLPAEYLRTAGGAALAAEQVDLQSLQRHDLDQILEQLVHGD